jgi:hypothetical protein
MTENNQVKPPVNYESNQAAVIPFSQLAILPAHTDYEDGSDNVPKLQHIKFRRRGITQKKAHSIESVVKI